ncbi:hypothetical protein [Leptospira terpstrae]|uniref:Uncharacterized protein n=1 Tax=Leptospira terpstrae serovar Hualin str. LT 11-33 = ATCC 700639 TaxID=1257025 RepID=N1VZK6_9LEPT|nr:hypothetical protein [Leptospira terpstrae]EMY62197.1 hypothetical protein LEP1GSC203_3702 [Leptospira terpstrae serovar Hualin str. LT 11-33 = ATCC 700639]
MNLGELRFNDKQTIVSFLEGYPKIQVLFAIVSGAPMPSGPLFPNGGHLDAVCKVP